MNFYDDQDATAGMTNEQKSQAAKIMVLSMAKVWGEFRHINKMFRDSTPDFQILSIDDYYENALGWLQCIEDRLLDALMESPLMPIFEDSEDTEELQEVSIGNLRGFLHMVAKIVESDMADQLKDMDTNEINRKIKEEMVADAQKEMAEKEIGNRLEQLNN